MNIFIISDNYPKVLRTEWTADVVASMNYGIREVKINGYNGSNC